MTDNTKEIKKQLKGMKTKELLSLLKTARACGGSYIDCIEITIEQIKNELATREHVPNKIEAKIIRQKRAKFFKAKE